MQLASDFQFIYSKYFSLQKLSLFSCACTIAASPVIIYMSSASSFGAKASIALTLCGFGFFTTGEQSLPLAAFSSFRWICDYSFRCLSV